MQSYDVKLIQKGEHYVLQECIGYSRLKGKAQKEFYRPKDDFERIEIIFDKITPKKVDYESTLVNSYGGVDYDIEEWEFEEYYKKAEDILKFKKVKNRKDSIRRSRNTVLDTAMCNSELSTFITLTYADNVTDFKNMEDDFVKFRQKINKHMKRNCGIGFKFIATFERQKRGAWHCHMLTNIKKEYFSSITGHIEYTKKKGSKVKTDERKIIENEFSKRFWDNGFCDYIELSDNNGTALYISKYMLKDTDDILELETDIKSRYRISRGLNKPIEHFEKLEEEKEYLPKDVAEKENKQFIRKKKPSNLVAMVDGLDKNLYYIKTTYYCDYITKEEQEQGITKIIKETKYYKKIDEKLVNNRKNNKNFNSLLTCPKKYCNILT